MFRGIIRLFGSHNERVVKQVRGRVERIEALAPGMEKLTDAELRAKTDEFRARLKAGETLDDILEEAFAVVREMSSRTPPPGAERGLRQYPVQLVGGIVLHQGGISEMMTGEGKTLVAVAPAYLNAIEGKGVHVITVNDYLAQRDRDWMGPIYEKLGLTVGAIQSNMNNAQRRAMYACDITYGTNNEFGFDYLRDNMKQSLEDQVQRSRNYAILDEVDNILIDEARTPLIISGPSEGDTRKYYEADRVVRQLVLGVDFEVKEKESQVPLTEDGIVKAQRIVGVESFYQGAFLEWPHLIEQGLRAHHLFFRDKDYVVDQGEDGGPEIVIIDEFTGRKMSGRRWSDGLHQAVEAKEGIDIKAESQTLATITFQNFFKLYNKIAGMTGTAMTEAGEFLKIYNLGVVNIPTNRPIARKDLDDRIYADQRDKYAAVLEEIREIHAEGRPILVGTTSIENSEKISTMLTRSGIEHEVLNAKHHQREAEIIAQAGRKGMVTIATNMAGRGTDIVLGGNAEGMLARWIKSNAWDPEENAGDISAARERIEAACRAEKKEVLELGGLHVLGTERHESRRIDNQLRGRCGRQGDPGSTRFYLALDDDLMRRFASDNVASMLKKLGLKDGQAIEHKWINRSVASAQKKVENRNFEIRKNLLEYDDVMNEQRKLVYDRRRRVLEGERLREMVEAMLEEVTQAAVATYCGEEVPTNEWEWTELESWYQRKTGREIALNHGTKDSDRVAEELMTAFRALYDERDEELGRELQEQVERYLLLNAFDVKWKEHLQNVDALKSGVGLRGYAQVDPKVEYKREAYSLFEELIRSIQDEVTDYIFRVEVKRPDDYAQVDDQWGGQTASHEEIGAYETSRAQNEAAIARDQSGQPATPFVRDEQKVGRNDPCPCGSGRKYKKCHGATD
ncbi:MAG: preprotein translocase subunit SecA [Planctomycetota bacterium]